MDLPPVIESETTVVVLGSSISDGRGVGSPPNDETTSAGRPFGSDVAEDRFDETIRR